MAWIGFKCSGPLLDPKKDDVYPHLQVSTVLVLYDDTACPAMPCCDHLIRLTLLLPPPTHFYLQRKSAYYVKKFYPAGWKGPHEDNRVASVAWATRPVGHGRFPPIRMWLVLNKIDIVEWKKDPTNPKYKQPEHMASAMPAFRVPADDCTFSPLLAAFNKKVEPAQASDPGLPITIVDFLRHAFCADGETMIHRLLRDGAAPAPMEEDDNDGTSTSSSSEEGSTASSSSSSDEPVEMEDDDVESSTSEEEEEEEEEQSGASSSSSSGGVVVSSDTSSSSSSEEKEEEEEDDVESSESEEEEEEGSESDSDSDE